MSVTERRITMEISDVRIRSWRKGKGCSRIVDCSVGGEMVMEW
jgi:hypothetical protein